MLWLIGVYIEWLIYWYYWHIGICMLADENRNSSWVNYSYKYFIGCFSFFFLSWKYICFYSFYLWSFNFKVDILLSGLCYSQISLCQCEPKALQLFLGSNGNTEWCIKESLSHLGHHLWFIMERRKTCIIMSFECYYVHSSVNGTAPGFSVIFPR